MDFRGRGTLKTGWDNKYKTMLLPQKVPVLDLGFKKVEFDDWRSFFEALHFWGHNTDFTYRDRAAERLDEFVANFLLSYFVDVNLPLDYFCTKESMEDFTKKELMQMFRLLQKFGVERQLSVRFINTLAGK